ncbi:hypothetical protein AWZ03_010831 [Drosophila navojoa]|uniref:Phenoloxidase-activating factor 2 n=1 Tax=Drosophila navojoa TaxID=7232 RepID=A0A484B1Y3_DRONA|nr:phenoloxidase-activating factor 2-like [Drosophila navojoa]TDG42753.1 hypothetical protein AWZ03_010831 [Drosophila navojoa]
MECVSPSQCRNNTLKQFGAFNRVDCNRNQICCPIANKIEVDSGQWPQCGYRLENGIPQATDRRIAENEANFAEFPWMVALLRREDPVLTMYVGGGSLLTPQVVLTAAHKVLNISESELIARAGEWDHQTAEEAYLHQDRNVQLKIIHKRFDAQSKANNIALLQLQVAFVPSPHISPICLPDASETFDNRRCIITGWGKSLDNRNDYHHVLKKIVVPVLSRSRCNDKLRQIYNPFFNLDYGHICAGAEKGIDACLGDGGSPLVCPIPGSPNRYHQAGIAVWGIGCGLENVPAGYVNVPHYIPWIQQELNKLGIDLEYNRA